MLERSASASAVSRASMSLIPGSAASMRRDMPAMMIGRSRSDSHDRQLRSHAETASSPARPGRRARTSWTASSTRSNGSRRSSSASSRSTSSSRCSCAISSRCTIPDYYDFGQHAARHPDLLGHRRDQLSRHPHHRRPGLGQRRRRATSAGSTCSRRWCCCSWSRCRPTRCSTRCVDTYDDHVLTYRSAAADLAVLRCCLGRRRLRRAADRDPHLPPDLPSRGDARSPKSRPRSRRR